jgi:hypothetical protein
MAGPATLCCCTFSLPRRGNAPGDCQDASAVAPHPRPDSPEWGRFAVADGASESAHAGPWARLLVEDFVHSPGCPPDWACRLPPLQERWEEQIGRGRDPEAGLDWFIEAHERPGAFATFLGVAVEEHTWSACAVGDSCLAHTRPSGLVRTFPLARAADFNSTPALVGSRTSPATAVRSTAFAESTWEEGDTLWLMTDALARWFLSEAEAGRRPWDVLDQLLCRPDSAFRAWAERLRDEGVLRDDDVTLVAVKL